MGSSVQLSNDIDLWRKYINFIQEHLKDASSVRANFEQKMKHSKLMSTATKIDIMLENASFEE